MTEDKKEAKQTVPRSNSFWVPVAVILAGALIAGAVVYSGKTDNSAGDPSLQGAVGELAQEDPELPPEPGSEKFDISIDDDAIDGKKDAPVMIVEFSDFECSFCARHTKTIDKIKKEYGDKVAVVFRDYPLEFHEDAQKAAEAAECAADQNKFWEYHDKLFANQQALDVASLKKYAGGLKLKQNAFDECLDSDKYEDEVQKDLKDGNAAEVTGTPATFVNGRKVVGAQPYDVFKKIIDEELAK